jgi:hypothetical protein
MINSTLGSRIFRNVSIFCLLAAPMLAGCGAKPAANVKLTAMDDSRKLEQTFTNAYFNTGAGGAYDILLVEQAQATTEKRSGMGDGIAIGSTPLTHIMHVRVLWRPKKAIRADSPTATNASVTWSVIAGDGSGRIDYDGVGFANVYGGDDEIIVRLANIAIKPAASTGLGDPIGASRLNANFKAKRDPRMVKSLVAKTKQNNAAAAASMDTISPPARHPGP